jgi:hypothetical protein
MAENALLVSTETPSGRRDRVANTAVLWGASLIVFGGAVFMAFAPDRWFSPSVVLSDRIWGTLLGIAVGVFLLILPRLGVRGNWRLDDQGVSFTPLCGKAKHMAWQDVDSVSGIGTACILVFRAGKVTLPMNLKWEPRHRREEAMNFLRERPGEAFDMFRCPLRPMVRISVRRLLWASALAAAFTLLWLGGIIVAIRCLHPNGFWLRGLGLCSLAPIALVYGIYLILARRDGHRARGRETRTTLLLCHSLILG